MTPTETPELARDGMASFAAPKGSAARLEALTRKIERGERLTNDERAERQGIIFNHSGKCGHVAKENRK